jgi:hypothetical protein
MENLTIENRKESALKLYRTKECPHCGHAISTLESVSMLWGDGYRQLVAVIHADGSRNVIPLAEFNPQTMELLE